MFLIYSMLFTAGVILAAPYYLWRLRGHILSGAGWRERLGFLPDQFREPVVPRSDPFPAGTDADPADAAAGSGAIWIHAVSVGETLALVRLVRELQGLYPRRRIFMSHVTPAGREIGEKRLPSATASPAQTGTGQPGGSSAMPLLAGRFFLPLDWTWCVARVFGRIRPAMLIIAETELWPNLVREAHRRGARVVLVNARLSERSFRGYQRFRFFMRRVLGNVDAVCVQTASDAERFRLLGVPPERVMVAGNVKFDGAPPRLGEISSILQTRLRAAGRAPVIVAGSTMAGEEELVLDAWKEIRRHYAEALLVLAPRHPARFEAVDRLLTERGVKFVRRTALGKLDEELSARVIAAEVVLLDTIGELAGMFGLADLVFVGGSLVPTGGHNLLEPAYWSKPILFGPHMHNFRDIATMFLEEHAGIQVENSSGLAREAIHLLDDVNRRLELGRKAKQILDREAGATERTLAQIERLLQA